MAVIEGQVNSITRRASSDLSAKQYHAVKCDSGSRTVTISGAGEQALGILLNIPGNGSLADVSVSGFAKAKSGGTITQGEFLKVDAAGKLVPVSTDKDFYIARALENAVANDVFSVQVTSGFYAV